MYIVHRPIIDVPNPMAIIRPGRFHENTMDRKEIIMVLTMPIKFIILVYG